MFLLELNLTLTTYNSLLVKLFGVYAPVKKMFDKYERKAPFPVPLFKQRKKLPLLEKDLLNIELAVDELNSLPLCSFLPDISTPSHILGCMYVLEGATLGGQVILKHVKSSMNLDAGSGTAFFNNYSPAVEPTWKSFIQRIDGHNQGNGLGLTIVKHSVESQDGEISYESRSGQGSTFRVLLPVRFTSNY